MQFILAIFRYIISVAMYMLEAPWQYLENKADMLDPSAQRAARPRAAAAESPPSSAAEEPAMDDNSAFMTTAQLLAERARLQQELHLAEMAEEEVL